MRCRSRKAGRLRTSKPEWREVFKDPDFREAFFHACRKAFREAANGYEKIKRRKRAASRRLARMRDDRDIRDLIEVLDGEDSKQ